jgi:nucleoside-diphosphate-sugar epimerase
MATLVRRLASSARGVLLSSAFAPARRSAHTVGLTGAGGELGSILRRKLTERGFAVVAIEKAPLRVVGAGEVAGEGEIDNVVECRTADFAGAGGHACVTGVFEGCDTVVHLAAYPKPWASYAEVLAANMVGDQLFYEEATRAKCRRFVYASTNHVQHGATTRTTPETLDSDRYGRHVDGYDLMKTSDAPVPDSFYAVSKLHGENLGRLYARDHGLEVGEGWGRRARAKRVWLLSVGWVWSRGVSGEGEEACEKDE